MLTLPEPFTGPATVQLSVGVTAGSAASVEISGSFTATIRVDVLKDPLLTFQVGALFGYEGLPVPGLTVGLSGQIMTPVSSFLYHNGS